MNRDHEESIQISTIEPIQGSTNEPDEKYLIPLSGKWIINQDPILIGKNFQTLTNMRYVTGHPEGILGMTKINTSVMNATYYKARSAFHFNKAQFPETHILVQAFRDDGLISVILDNESSVPNTDIDFSPTRLYPPVVDPNVYNTAIGNFSIAPNGQVVYCDGTNSLIWGGFQMKVAAVITSDAALTSTEQPTNPKDVTEKVQNSKQDSDNVFTFGGTQKYVLVGSTRPLQGVWFYVDPLNCNSTPGHISCKTWNGVTATWDTCAVATDTTRNIINTNISLAQSGEFTFSSTVGVTTPSWIEGYFVYWYQFYLPTGSASIYQITLNAPMQPIIDLWDGIYRTVGAAYKMTSTRTDIAMQVFKDDYDTDITYANIGGLGTFSEPNNCLEFAFPERQCGLFFSIPSDYQNSNACHMDLDYWNGSAYVTVGTITDGTSSGTISFAMPGTVTWNNVNISDETKTNKLVGNRRWTNFSDPTTTESFPGWIGQASVYTSTALYYYRVRFSATLSGSVRLNFVGGIPSQVEISGFSFPLYAANRIMLGCDTTGQQNLLFISADGKPGVFNGSDSYRILLGDDSPLTCGTSIFAQYASNIYNMALIFKKSETWSLVWTQSTTGTEWTRFQISPNVGCPAPRTLKTVSASFENNINTVKVIAIWRGEDGIYVSNGQSPLRVSHDIDDVFDQTKPLHVNNLMSNIECSFVDQHFLEYHWLWASNENTTLDQEFVLDLKTWKWYNIDRTTGNRLQCGIDVIDAYGNYYSYGFIDTGYMEWLESGTTFDGEPITNTLVTGELTLVENDIFQETSITRFNLITLPKNVDTMVTLLHTMDGASTGTSYSISQASTKRYKNSFTDIFSGSGVFHTLSLTSVTSGESKGFEPLAAAILFKKERTRIT